MMQDALLDEEGGVPDAADSKNDAEPDGLALHSMPHQARAATTGHANHAAHEVRMLHYNSLGQAALSHETCLLAMPLMRFLPPEGMLSVCCH